MSHQKQQNYSPQRFQEEKNKLFVPISFEVSPLHKTRQSARIKSTKMLGFFICDNRKLNLISIKIRKKKQRIFNKLVESSFFFFTFTHSLQSVWLAVVHDAVFYLLGVSIFLRSNDETALQFSC